MEDAKAILESKKEEVVKVHLGLKRVTRDQVYHLGHYEIDCQDGSLKFEVHVRFCADKDCICDNLQITWRTLGKEFPTWYSSDREWFWHNYKPLPDELTQIFRSAEQTETFQERSQHLLYLHRKQALADIDLLDVEVPLTIPQELLITGHDCSQGILGKFPIKIKGKMTAVPFSLDFCTNQECYCDNLFASFTAEEKELQFIIDRQNSWEAADEDPATPRLLPKIKRQALASKKFHQLLLHFRRYRRLQNYKRFVAAYPETIAH